MEYMSIIRFIVEKEKGTVLSTGINCFFHLAYNTFLNKDNILIMSKKSFTYLPFFLPITHEFREGFSSCSLHCLENAIFKMEFEFVKSVSHKGTKLLK